MKKETVFVRTKNRNQANMYAEILKKMGQKIRPDFNSNTELNDPDLDYRDSGWILGFSTSEKKEITFGQLVDLLNNPKIAVKVENEKEFKALMKYYDSLGYKSKSGEEKSYSKIHNTLEFEKRFTSFNDEDYHGKDNYQIIPFSEFAAEHNIKLPLYTNQNGDDFFEDSECHWVYESNGEYKYNSRIDFHPNHVKLLSNHSHEQFVFTSKQAALDWIEAQKPKQIEVEIGERDLKAIIFKDGSDCISFKQRSKMVNIAHLTFKEIRDIKDAMANI